MNNKFTVEKFFDMSLVSEDLKVFLQKATNVWELIPNIQDFLLNAKTINGIKPSASHIFIHPTAVIDPTVRIMGPAYIGENAHVGFQAYLRENVIVDAHVKVGHASEIKNSIILSHSAVAHFNYVGDSVVGSHVNISAGAVFANFRLDKKSVAIINKEERIDTNLKKLGAIVGDNSNIGTHAVLNPGTLLGKNTIVYPLISVKGIHSDHEIIK